MELETSIIPAIIRALPTQGKREVPISCHRAFQGRAAKIGLAAAILAILTLGSGCTGTKFWKNDADSKPPSNDSSSLFPPMTKSNSGQDSFNPGITSTPRTGPTVVPFASEIYDKFTKIPPVEMVVAWRSWIDYLPDPTQGGRKGPGLAGQMFLFGRGAIPAIADGTLTVDLYDETPRQPGHLANVPERWSFDKEALKALQSTDERFGKCYILFLPWPTYRPDVTQVRITARFDTDAKKSLSAEEAQLTISATRPNSTMISSESFGPNQGLQSLLGQTALGAGMNMGLGSLTSTANVPNSFGAGGVPLGMIGSQLNGAPAANMSPPVSPDPPTPISRVPVSNVPASTLQPPGGAPSIPNANPANGVPSYPIDNRGLTPVSGVPQGLPPMAFTATPGGR